MTVRLQEHLIVVPDDVRELILILCEQAKTIRREFIKNVQLAGGKNAFGEDQLQIDVFADRLILHALRESSLVRTVASEEQDAVVEISKAKGSWGIAIDPLDGSSNVKTNLAVGTIVGMWNEGDVLEKGRRLDCALYFLYGPLTTLVYAYKGKGAHEFVLDEKTGEFLLRAESLQIPEGKLYGSGALANQWLPVHWALIAELEKQSYKLRYSGSLVADFNQILHYGGIFAYPASQKDPNGKLRLLFEANPLGFICEEAGGLASTGTQRILDVQPEKIDQRTPLLLGDKKTIELAESIYAQG